MHGDIMYMNLIALYYFCLCTEAECAFSKKKMIIPVTLEYKYEPDG